MSESFLKTMEYKKGNTEVLGNGTYEGFKWFIVSYGTHPCAYIIIESSHELYKKSYFDFDLNVHGGLTYTDFGLHDIIPKTEWVIGWDYNHYGDYSLYMPEGKKYTSMEIYDDVIAAIDDIKKGDFYVREL